MSTGARSQELKQACQPVITSNKTVVTAQQRADAGKIAQPPLTDQADGFAWPDTPMGVIKTASGYTFFASDGGLHSRQHWHGKWYGNNKYGSATMTSGTLDNPLGTGAPIDVTIARNPNRKVDANYRRYDYMGGGPVYQVPAGETGAGNLLMVYHAEIPTQSSFYSVLALASSLDGGMSWTDLGEIIRLNQDYKKTLDGFDIGLPPLVASPDGKYFYIYFRDWIANGTNHWGHSITLVSVARVPMKALYDAAFGNKPHAAPFRKYYKGGWTEPGIGGFSSDLNKGAPYSGELQVAYNSAIQRYMMIIGEGILMAYSESVDGMRWTSPIVLYDFRKLKDKPNTYVMPVGTGEDPHILGSSFDVFYTRYPTNGEGWNGASVGRFTLSCK